jgi:hypothetical protein
MLAGLLTVLIAASSPAAAQAPDAAERCTPDVMRLCSEFVPDPDNIVACLKAKRRQLSATCLSALTYHPPKDASDDGTPKRRRRH